MHLTDMIPGMYIVSQQFSGTDDFGILSDKQGFQCCHDCLCANVQCRHLAQDPCLISSCCNQRKTFLWQCMGSAQNRQSVGPQTVVLAKNQPTSGKVSWHLLSRVALNS